MQEFLPGSFLLLQEGLGHSQTLLGCLSVSQIISYPTFPWKGNGSICGLQLPSQLCYGTRSELVHDDKTAARWKLRVHVLALTTGSRSYR